MAAAPCWRAIPATATNCWRCPGAAGASFYLRDAHGSTRSPASGSAAITDGYTYDAYGNTRGSER